MRPILAVLCLTCAAPAALAGERPADGPVVAGSFGMGGSDYYGDTRARMPFSAEESPRPIGMADIERVRAARGRAESPSRRSPAGHGRAHRG